MCVICEALSTPDPLLFLRERKRARQKRDEFVLNYGVDAVRAIRDSMYKARHVAPLDPAEFHKDEPAPGDAVFSDSTVVQHKTAPANPLGGTWSSQGQNDARKFTRGDMIQAARMVLQERVRQLIEEFEETHRATVTALHLARSLRLVHVLDGDYNERTNYVTAEVVPWP